MRIDSNQPVSSQLSTERTSRNSGKAGSAAGASAEGATFSPDPSGVTSLEAQVMATPEIRSDRVAALRESIRNGSYQVDAGSIADAILRESSR